MRTLFFLMLFFFTLANTYGQSTIYHPLPDTNSTWNEESWRIIPISPYCEVRDRYTLFFNGDTIIGVNRYKKIYASGYTGAPPCLPPGYNYYNEYRGALRQDSAQKKVFYIYSGAANEHIIYDFSLNVGDTLEDGFNIIIGIDSALVGTSFHKRFLLSTSGQPQTPDTNYAIIEGVGSTKGLLNTIIPDFEAGAELKYFCYNQIQVYPATNSACPFNVGISELSIENPFTLFPNPFVANSTLHSSRSLKNGTLSAINYLGQTVLRIENISGESIDLASDKLSKGLYIFHLTDEDLYFDKRMLILK
jgi:hypothetical protein